MEAADALNFWLDSILDTFFLLPVLCVYDIRVGYVHSKNRESVRSHNNAICGSKRFTSYQAKPKTERKASENVMNIKNVLKLKSKIDFGWKTAVDLLLASCQGASMLRAIDACMAIRCETLNDI